MRERNKQITEPGTLTATVDVERDNWRVQKLVDGRYRVAVEYGTVIVIHTGSPGAIRSRLAVDTPAFVNAIGSDITEIAAGRLTTPAIGSPR